MDPLHPNRRRALLLLACAAVPPAAKAGAWSHHSFGNDGALDWVIDFMKTPTPDFVRETLTLMSGQFVDADRGQAIIAAAEVVAASLGRPGQDLPKEVAAIAARTPERFRPLVPLAHDAVTTVLRGKSELKRLWNESASLRPQWEGSVNGLRKRLQPNAA